ncbi:MAG: hypothetical protein AB7G62_01930 [Magnetospirillum sp.]
MAGSVLAAGKPAGHDLTEGKVGAACRPYRAAMSKVLIIVGIAVMAVSGLAAIAAIIVGSSQWLGLAAPFSPHMPPQSLVVGGLFLGVPIIACGWAMVWFGGWMKHHR